MTRSFSRSIVCLIAFAVTGCLSAPIWGASPSFSRELPFPSNQGMVERIVTFEDLNIDLVIIRGGLLEGFQVGVLSEVRREGRSIADLVVTDAFLNFSFALVTRMDRGRELQRGDLVQLQTNAS